MNPTLRKKLFSLTLLLVFSVIEIDLFAQQDTTSHKRFGAYATLDLCYGTRSKLFKETFDRKFSFGLSFFDRKKRFQLLAGVGAKVIKAEIIPYRFSNMFTTDVKYRYAPINDTSESQLIGSIVYSGENLKMRTVTYYLHIGFILHNKFQPSFNFYYGEQLTLIKDHRLAQYTDPQHGDYYEVYMKTNCYEFKLGMTIPFKFLRGKPYSYTIHAGYRYMNHNDIQFSNTPLTAYTRYNIAEWYNRDSKWLFGITFNIWSNWKGKNMTSNQ